MELRSRRYQGHNVVELHSNGIAIESTQDALDLMAAAYETDARIMVWHRDSIAARFFDLSTGVAGDILQKFANYQMKLGIVGEFTNVGSDSLQAFISECNRGGQIAFAPTVEAVLANLLRR